MLETKIDRDFGSREIIMYNGSPKDWMREAGATYRSEPCSIEPPVFVTKTEKVIHRIKIKIEKLIYLFLAKKGIFPDFHKNGSCEFGYLQLNIGARGIKKYKTAWLVSSKDIFGFYHEEEKINIWKTLSWHYQWKDGKKLAKHSPDWWVYCQMVANFFSDNSEEKREARQLGLRIFSRKIDALLGTYSTYNKACRAKEACETDLPTVLKFLFSKVENKILKNKCDKLKLRMGITFRIKMKVKSFLRALTKIWRV